MSFVLCPNCGTLINYEEKTPSSLFYLGKPIRCDSCSIKFNIFEVWRNITNTIPEATRLIDESTEIIFSKWIIEGSNQNEHELTNQFFQKNLTDIFLTEIISNALRWGTCFIKHSKIDNEIKLEIIDPCDYEIMTENDITTSGTYLGEKVKSIVNFRTNEKIDRANLCLLPVHMVHGPVEDLGTSVLGYWFNSWYILLHRKDILSYEDFSNNYDLHRQGITIEKIDNGRMSRHHLSSAMNQLISLIVPREKTMLGERMKFDYISPPKIKFL